MKNLLILVSAASLASSLTSCTISAHAYPVAGPALKNPTVSEAKFTWAGNGSGSATVTLPSGEVCTGRYATVVGGVVSPAARKATPDLAASISNGNVGGIQTSRAMLVGDRGTMLDFEGYTSGASPTHGFGVAHDQHGSVWKLIW